MPDLPDSGGGPPEREGPAAPVPRPAAPEPSPRGAIDSEIRAARARIDRFSASVFRRLNLAGLLLVGAALCTADFALVGNRFWMIVLTALQALLAVPWGWTVVRMDQIESRVLDSKRLGRFRRVAGHAVNFALLATVLTEKALVLHAVGDDEIGPVGGAYKNYVVFVFVLLAAGLLGRGSRFARFLGTLADHPARLMAISFAVVALFGGLVLTLPISVRDLRNANFVDGLFTATSAVCVTGLAVNDISVTYTGFGQFVIFALVQAGGLGIMVLTAAVAILAGRKLRTRSTATLAEMIDADSFATLRRTIRHILFFTLALEAAGAVVLYATFSGRPEIGFGPEHEHPAAGAGSHLWSAVFHSVSAFCNAGFSLSHGNLVVFADSYVVSGTVGGLIVLGGLGFPVLDELWERWRHRRSVQPRRMSLHARVVLVTSAALIVAGTLMFLVLEWNGALGHLPWDERVLAALFQSVSTRTAGFNTVNFGAMAAPALLASCFLMFVGASPGSTGGGIKTTTLAVLLAAFRGELRGASVPRVFDRAFPEATVRRAASVAVGSAVVVGVAWFALLLTETLEPLAVLFETVSAFATCGLSTGITAKLTVAGKLVVTVLMFVGRIGPMTIALAVVARPRVEHFGVPQEKVLIG